MSTNVPPDDEATDDHEGHPRVGTPVNPDDHATDDRQGEGHPIGTLVLAGLFLVLMIATWLVMYLTMLERS